MTPENFVTALVPALARASAPRFNLFDVMHHGTHEKQLSNVFAWLLDPAGTHALGEAFGTILTQQVNTLLPEGAARIPEGGYTVQQEVPLPTGTSVDIVDIVLDRPDATVCIENYYTSDGHGHGFQRYQAHASRGGRNGVVVLLCQQEDRSRLSHGWDGAIVLTYNSLLRELLHVMEKDRSWQRQNSDAAWFIGQLYRRFEEGTAPMSDQGLLDFVLAMCDAGEASRYRTQSLESAAKQFGTDVATQASAQFLASRDLLHRIKGSLRRYASGPLKTQFDASHGPSFVAGVTANWSGIYQWSANVHLHVGDDAVRVSIMFGPTAWYANNGDSDYEPMIDPAPDYSRLLLGLERPRTLAHSAVTLEEALDGLDPNDARLHDEIVRLLESASAGAA